MPKTQRNLTRIIEKQGEKLHALLLRLTFCEKTAEELLQELYLKLFRSGCFDRSKKPEAYARRAAINLAFDWRRRRRRDKLDHYSNDSSVFGGLEDGIQGPVERMIIEEQCNAVLEGIEKLPHLSRECLVMRYIEQESYDEVAKQVNKTPHQVRALCYRAICQLRTLLAEYSEDLKQ